MSDHSRADEGEGREPGPLFFSRNGLTRLKKNLAAVDPFEIGALIGDWISLSTRAAQAEAEVARLTAALAEAEATASLLRKDNERLRWRHPAVLPAWNDLPDGLRAKLARTADGYDPDWGGDLAVNMYAALRQDMMEAPHADN